MILLLFPVHTFMIWNNFGTKFYIWDGESNMLSTAITIVNPWFMAVLFVIAGMCARYSLGKRTVRKFPLIISLVSLILIKHIAYEKISSKMQKANLAMILLLFLPVWLFYYLGDFGGFSLGKYFVLYLLGYYVLSNERVLEKLDMLLPKIIRLWASIWTRSECSGSWMRITA